MPLKSVGGRPLGWMKAMMVALVKVVLSGAQVTSLVLPSNRRALLLASNPDWPDGRGPAWPALVVTGLNVPLKPPTESYTTLPVASLRRQ